MCSEDKEAYAELRKKAQYSCTTPLDMILQDMQEAFNFFDKVRTTRRSAHGPWMARRRWTDTKQGMERVDLRSRCGNHIADMGCALRACRRTGTGLSARLSSGLC